jgi:hypothetical protein
MFAGLKHLIGSIAVEVHAGLVTVEGVPTAVIGSDIKRLWGTGKIEANLFEDIQTYSFTFPEFFALEVHYALSRLIDDRKTKSNRHTLAKIVKALEEKTWLRHRDQKFAPILDFGQLERFKFTPKSYQSDFFHAYDQLTQQLELNGMYLAGAPGSGKTFAGIAWAEMLHADLTVVLAPKNLLEEVWGHSLETLFKNPADAPSYWLCTSDEAYAGQRYIIANYEWLTKLSELLKTLKYKLLAILIDEGHNFNELSNRTEALIDFCQSTGSGHILWLSGTPIKARAVEATPLLRCIDPKFTPEVEIRFRRIFGVSSSRANDIMNNRLNGLLFRIESKELGLLPPIFTEIKVKIPNAHRFTLKAISKDMKMFTTERLAYYTKRKREDEKTFYDAVEVYARGKHAKKDQLSYYHRCLAVVIRSGGDARFCKEEMIFCNKFENQQIIPALPKEQVAAFKEAKTIVKYVRLKIQGECLGRVVGQARINAHVEMAQYIDYVSLVEAGIKKTLIFTSFVKVLEGLKVTLDEIGLKPLFVYADTIGQLSNILEQFENDADINPLGATYKSLSTGMPLTMANQLLMIDAPWRDYLLQQTVARVNRLSQDTQTYIYTTVLDTGEEVNISSRSLDILNWSKQQAEQITGVSSPYDLSDAVEDESLALEALCNDMSSTINNTVPRFMQW